MAWAKSGSKTLDSTASSMTATGLSDNKFNFIITHYEQGSSGNGDLIINGENSSGDYSLRYSNDTGGASNESTSISHIYTGGWTDKPVFAICFICYFSGAEKLVISMGNIADSGAGHMRTLVGKVVAGTSDPITSTAIVARSGTLNMVSGDNISVLGSDLTPTIGKPTNVQIGSRWEETDTRKVYNYKESDTIESTATYQYTSMTGSQTIANGGYEISAQKIVNSNSELVGETIGRIDVPMAYFGGTGTVTAGVFDSSGNTLHTFGTKDISTVSTSYNPYTWYSFTGTSHYTLSVGEYVGVKIGSSGSLHIPHRDNTSQTGGNYYDGSNSHWDRWNGSWSASFTNIDQSIKLYVGTTGGTFAWQEIGT